MSILIISHKQEIGIFSTSLYLLYLGIVLNLLRYFYQINIYINKCHIYPAAQLVFFEKNDFVDLKS